MTTDTRVTGAATPLILNERDGTTRELWMSPLSDRDISELDEWVRARFIRTAALAIDESLNEEQQDRILDIAMRRAARLSWMSGEGAQILATVQGMVHLVWRTCRKRHPELTEDSLRELMLNPDNISHVNKKFTSLNEPPKSMKHEKKVKTQKKGKKNKRRQLQKERH